MLASTMQQSNNTRLHTPTHHQQPRQTPRPGLVGQRGPPKTTTPLPRACSLRTQQDAAPHHPAPNPFPHPPPHGEQVVLAVRPPGTGGELASVSAIEHLTTTHGPCRLLAPPPRGGRAGRSLERR